MTRFMIGTMLLLTYMIGSAWAQTGAAEGQSTPREIRRMPPVVERNMPIKPAESSRDRAGPQVTPPVAPEAVYVISTKPGENERDRLVFALRSLPATKAAGTLQSLFKIEGSGTSQEGKDKVVIVPEMTTNCLIVSGPPAAIKEIGRLLNELDRPAAIIRLVVRIIEMPGDKAEKSTGADSAAIKKTDSDSSQQVAKKTGEERLLVNAELSTLDGQTATVMLGSQEPQIANVSQTSRGRANSLQYVNVGTMIKLTPRIGPDKTVVLELEVQDSRSGPIEEGAVMATLDNGEQVRTPSIDTFQTQTTLHLQDGKTTFIGGMTRNGKARRIAVTAHVIQQPAGKTSE